LAVDLFTFVDLYTRIVDTAAHILTKGADHARKQGVSEIEMLDWRLIDDMNPLRFQLRVVCNFPRLWPARVAGLPLSPEIGDDRDVAGFQAALADARRFLAALPPEIFVDREEIPLTVDIGLLEPTLPAARWLTVFATTNLYFHVSMAYAILRAHGVPIGKVDLFPTGL
jgi:hypothetical protein